MVHPFWYNGNLGYHIDLGGTTKPPNFPVIAQQYLLVYEDEFHNPTTMVGFMRQPKVTGQHVIFDSVPGDLKYSPIWHNNWVLVPKDCKANTFKSVSDVVKSNDKIVVGPIWVN